MRQRIIENSNCGWKLARESPAMVRSLNEFPLHIVQATKVVHILFTFYSRIIWILVEVLIIILFQASKSFQKALVIEKLKN